MCLRNIQLIMELTGTRDSVSLESAQEEQCSERLLGPLEQNVFCLLTATEGYEK